MKPMAVGFVLLGVDVTLDDGCGMRTFALFQGREMSPGLFRDFMEGSSGTPVQMQKVANFLFSPYEICVQN